MLSKAEILKADGLKTATVSVPEWGGDIVIREMTGAQRDVWDTMMASRYNAKTGQITSMKGMRAKMIVLSVVDEDGKPMFNDKDLDVISEKSSVVLDRICEAIRDINGLTDDAVEDAEGN